VLGVTVGEVESVGAGVAVPLSVPLWVSDSVGVGVGVGDCVQDGSPGVGVVVVGVSDGEVVDGSSGVEGGVLVDGLVGSVVVGGGVLFVGGGGVLLVVVVTGALVGVLDVAGVVVGATVGLVVVPPVDVAVGDGLTGVVVRVSSRSRAFPSSPGGSMMPGLSGMLTVSLLYDCIHRSTVDT
jgi:hypothetical protein